MDTKTLLKKYWFVLIVGVLLIVFVVFWGIDSNKKEKEKASSVIQTKVKDGKYILFSIDGEDALNADDFYKTIDENSINNIVLSELFEALADKEIETTEKIKTMASNQASYYLTNTSQEEIDKLMRANGLKKYGNLTTYFEKEFKGQELIKKYMTDHYEDVVKPYIEENKIKGISHILIKVADVEEITDENGNVTHIAHPTEEEEKKLNDVLEALKTDSFANVAAKYSEDTSAQDGGLLGYQKDSDLDQYVEEFKNCARELEYDKQSEVITSQFGYHILLVTEYKPEIYDLNNKTIQILYDIVNADSAKEYFKIIIEYSDKYNVVFLDENLKKVIDEHRNNDEEDQKSEEVESEILEDASDKENE